MLNSVVYYQGTQYLLLILVPNQATVVRMDQHWYVSQLMLIVTGCRAKDNPSNNLHGGAVGNWYYPDGTMVPRPSANSIALIRVGGGLHHVRLARLDTTLSAPLGNIPM